MKKPDPDFARLEKVLLRQGEPDRVPFYEHKADDEVVEEILGDSWSPKGRPAATSKQIECLKTIDFYYVLGYDYVPVSTRLPFGNESDIVADDTAPVAFRGREWKNEHEGVISNRADFEKFDWRRDKTDYSDLEYVSRHLPEGMKIVARTSGVLENVTWLMGYEKLCYAIYDDPGLVEDMFEIVGEILTDIHRNMAGLDEVGALCLGDDMGFKTGTLFAPDILRSYVLPWQKKIAAQAHERGKPFILHSCGKLDSIMDDLISDVGIDAKHSFEDAIMPVTEAKQKYGDRISLLGGVDMNVLSIGTVDEVRRYTRRVIETCAPGGGYALGSGNTVANYVNLDNYLAMLDEADKVGRY